MDATALWSFALASMLIELTPGPNMAWLAIVAVSEGRKPGFAAVAGVALGLAVVGGIAALGLGAIIAASPALYGALRWAGIAWLLWLALDGWRSAKEAPENAPVGWDLSRYFRRGLITNLLNPKAAVFYIAVLPGFTAADQPIVPQTLLLSAIFVIVATTIHAGIVALAGSLRGWLVDAQAVTVVRRVLSVALAGVAVWFWVSTAA